MRYATVSSGISAESAAWVPLGWEPVWYSEIAKFPSAVLAHHYPNTPNLGDMTKIHEDERFQQSIGTIDLISGGTPCQSFSVAGLRKGMADPRGNLALAYLGIVDKLRPRWVVWENVPGVLSSNKGRDFGAFLGALGQLGYGWAYRILDAQYFGVPQRRRRVFVVGHLGGWQRAAAVLFERESLSRNPPPGREKRQRVAGSLSSRASGGGGLGTEFECGGGVVAPTLQSGGKAAGSCTQQDAENGALITYAYQNPSNPLQKSEASATLRSRGGLTDERNAPALIVPPLKAHSAKTGKGDGAPLFFQSKASASNSMNPGGIAPSIDASKSDGLAVFTQNTRDEVRYVGGDGQTAGALGAETGSKQQNYLHARSRVRRLTVTECERLQGFPDGYTDVPGWKSNNPKKYGGNGTPDGPRYKALGNSMAKPVVQWIGQRILAVDSIES